MPEYISREAAKKTACSLCRWEGTENCEECEHPIDDIPAADVRPVRKGKWTPDYDYTEYDYDGSTPLPEPRKFQDGWQCSLCGAYEPSTVNFCPNCGADMREES